MADILADSQIIESWMTHLDPYMRANCPLIRLAIPGSHDSMMYRMMSHSPVTPEAPEFLPWLLKLHPRSVQNWVLTQNGGAGCGVNEQLVNGIRYFDIRACLQGDAFMLCHGVLSGESLQPLRDIRVFLDAHPLEVVILDFQHVYRCEVADHRRYCAELAEIFGEKIYGRRGNVVAECTLQEMAEKGKQVIVVYRDYVDEEGRFWTGDDLQTPWPNTTNIGELVEFLETSVQRRSKDAGHVTQCVLTPDAKFIMENLFHDLKSSCAVPVLHSLTQWIVTRRSGPDNWPGHNIFIADFVHLNDYQFVKAVLSLNGIRLQSFNPRAFIERQDGQKRDEKTVKFKWNLLCCCCCANDSECLI